MTVTLSRETQIRLTDAAQKEGIPVDTVIERLVAENLPQPKSVTDAISPKKQALIDLLALWSEEDATEDAEELARRDAENQRFFENLKANPISLRVPEV